MVGWEYSEIPPSVNIELANMVMYKKLAQNILTCESFCLDTVETKLYYTIWNVTTCSVFLTSICCTYPIEKAHKSLCSGLMLCSCYGNLINVYFSCALFIIFTLFPISYFLHISLHNFKHTSWYSFGNCTIYPSIVGKDGERCNGDGVL